MQTLLRNFETGSYFRTRTHWTHDPNEARDFQTTRAAIEKANELRLENVEIVSLRDDGTELCASKLDIT
jgi:hypothetical protein